jgi:CheY-like chemotaxis protein
MASGVILVADDDANFRTVVCAFLQAEGYRTATAENGSQAFSAAFEHKPDLIILDLVMPEVSGVTALELLADYRSKHGTPVLLVTGSNDKALLQKATALPNTRVMSKPFHMPELGFAVREMLAAKKG